MPKMFTVRIPFAGNGDVTPPQLIDCAAREPQKRLILQHELADERER